MCDVELWSIRTEIELPHFKLLFAVRILMNSFELRAFPYSINYLENSLTTRLNALILLVRCHIYNAVSVKNMRAGSCGENGKEGGRNGVEVERSGNRFCCCSHTQRIPSKTQLVRLYIDH